jgi:hypothetical protein
MSLDENLMISHARHPLEPLAMDTAPLASIGRTSGVASGEVSMESAKYLESYHEGPCQ